MPKINIGGVDHINGDGSIRDVTYNGSPVEKIVNSAGAAIWDKPIDGGWSSWSGWSACSESCGGGTQTRSRDCNNPSVQHGGYNCSGSNSDSQSCNTHSCVTFINASGGTVSTSGNYRYHTFTGSGALNISSTSNTYNTLEYLVVAGGGSAGRGNKCGGSAGAGGYIASSAAASTGNKPVSVGAGGSITGSYSNGHQGGNSSFYGTTTTGGGYGGRNWEWQVDTPAGSGGSGGGIGTTDGKNNSYGSGGSGIPGQGHDGGTGHGVCCGHSGGAGGGAGGVGGNGPNDRYNSATAGPGLAWLNGTTYATGGQGGKEQSSTCTNAPANTGNGGRGCGGNNGSAGAGGSGVVIVRYRYQ